MQNSDTRRRPRARKAAVLIAVASFAVLLFALTSGSATAGPPPGQLTLTVNVTGNGDGSVTDIHGGVTVNCQKNGGLITGCGDFAVPFANPADAVVVGLQATPIGNSHFTGWTVTSSDVTFGCGQQVTCYITMTADATVTANFTATPTGFPLTVQRTGNAANTGAVTSLPVGIACQPQVQNPVCAATFDQNTLVTLTATPATGTTFAGWGGACQGIVGNVCVVTMSTARHVTAEFDDQTFALTVTLQGNGGVTSNIQPGIDCFSGTNTGCSFSFNEGAQVILTAAAAPGYTFTGWSGSGCTGTGTCTVTVNGVSGVTATFAVAGVQATVTGNKVTCTGPKAAKRQLKITIDAQQAITITIRLKNSSGVTVQKKGPIVEEEADVYIVTMTIANSKPNGKYKAQVTMKNTFGASVVQNRNVKLKTCK